MSDHLFSIPQIEPEPNALEMPESRHNITYEGAAVRWQGLIEDELSNAHIGLCGYSAIIGVSQEIGSDFELASGRILFHPRVLENPWLLPVHLRHAIEIRLWLQLTPEREELPRKRIALLAGITVARFFFQIPEAERQANAASVPQWLRAMDSQTVASDSQLVQKLTLVLPDLMKFQGAVSTEPASEALIKEVVELAGVASPTEWTLSQQGDERLLVDPATGLSKYGCSSKPRPEAITFASCTASSVSIYAYLEAEVLRQRLMRAATQGGLRRHYVREIEHVRSRLRDLLYLEASDAELILCSSGTDAELYPLVLFRPDKKQKLINIIVAPDEVGSGTVPAAGGRHFSTRTPLGARVVLGEGVEGLNAEQIEVIGVPIRNEQGLLLSQEQMQESLTAVVAQAAQRADVVLLHMVDNTKTGMVVPTMDFVFELKKAYGEKLAVVVDACQFRLERRNLQRYLQLGFCVLITGSKFFTGPPFCGALLISSAYDIARIQAPLPAGFGQYFTRSELPPGIQDKAEALAPELNLGLLFRWVGALKEMTAFYSVPAADRTAILKGFRAGLVDRICKNPDLELLDAPIPYRCKDADASLWDAQPTIFSFGVRSPDSGRELLTVKELKAIYFLLNCDCSSALPESAHESEHVIAAQKCHIGQPVLVSRNASGQETGALRIACGARLISGIMYDRSLGAAPPERFSRELSDAGIVLAKISLILRNWERMKALVK